MKAKRTKESPRDESEAIQFSLLSTASETPEAPSGPKRRAGSIGSGKVYNLVSLFSGCGGMDLGFRGGFEFLGRTYQPLPFRFSWANDLNEAACRTYRRNIGDHIQHGDVWSLLDTLPRKADVVIGGFPCQDISVNGKGAGVDGTRSGLYRAMVEAVRLTKPKIFVAENVKGLLMKHSRTSFEQVMSDFRSLGYDVRCDLYQAAEFGIPQTRERVFIVGTSPRTKSFVPPVATHATDDFVTSREAIEDLEDLPETPSINHIWSRANKSPDQGNRRLKADRAAYTIRAECHGNIQYHYNLPRRISMREAARFQAFPDDFVFEAKLRETERQVGNAVPPVLAWHLARSILHSLR